MVSTKVTYDDGSPINIIFLFSFSSSPPPLLIVSRPCRRCINLGKTDTCIDVQHKKRGRPRLRDREAAAAAAAATAAGAVGTGKPEHSSGLPSQRMRGSISSSSSASTMKQSPRSEPTTFLSPPGDSNLLFSPSTNKPSSSISSMNSRERSVSSSASLWSQNARASAVAASDFSSEAPPTVSLILSTGLQCARCSIESHALLGFSPSDLLERSLFELVHPSEKQRLEQLWLSLIEPVGVKPQVVPANAETVMTLSPALLMAPAPGTVFMQETMRLRQRSGIFDFYSIRLHLGGGFGADLYRHHTLDRAYIVASLLKLGNDATHPDPNVLREARWNAGGDPRYFTTPQPGNNNAGGGSSGQAPSSGGVGGSGGSMYHHNTQTSSGAAGHYQSPPPPPSSTPSRYDWQRLDNENKPAAPLSSIQPQHHAPPPPPYSRPIYQEDYHQNDHHRDSRPRSAHDMEITPPSTASKRPNAAMGIAPSSTRPSLSAKTSATASSVTSSFSYSSRADRGGITCRV